MSIYYLGKRDKEICSLCEMGKPCKDDKTSREVGITDKGWG